MQYRAHTEAFFLFENTHEFKLAHWFYKANISLVSQDKYLKSSLGSHISSDKATSISSAYTQKKLVIAMDDKLRPDTWSEAQVSFSVNSEPTKKFLSRPINMYTMSSKTSNPAHNDHLFYAFVVKLSAEED